MSLFPSHSTRGKPHPLIDRGFANIFSIQVNGKSMSICRFPFNGSSRSGRAWFGIEVNSSDILESLFKHWGKERGLLSGMNDSHSHQRGKGVTKSKPQLPSMHHSMHLFSLLELLQREPRERKLDEGGTTTTLLISSLITRNGVSIPFVSWLTVNVCLSFRHGRKRCPNHSHEGRVSLLVCLCVYSRPAQDKNSRTRSKEKKLSKRSNGPQEKMTPISWRLECLVSHAVAVLSVVKRSWQSWSQRKPSSQTKSSSAEITATMMLFLSIERVGKHTH